MCEPSGSNTGKGLGGNHLPIEFKTFMTETVLFRKDGAASTGIAESPFPAAAVVNSHLYSDLDENLSWHVGLSQLSMAALWMLRSI